MEAPQLEFVCEIIAVVEKPLDVGDTGAGTRKFIPIIEGEFSGPKLSGSILPGGADSQFIKTNCIAELDARYVLKTDDGALIYVQNRGIRVADEEVLKKLAHGEKVNAGAYYFRTAPVFETSDGKYKWLMQSLFIAKCIRNPDNVVIEVWKVL